MKFEVGDIVKLKNYDLDEIPTLWVDDMYDMRGREVRITGVDYDSSKLSVDFYGDCWWVYMDDVEKIVSRNGEERDEKEIRKFTKDDLENGMIIEERDHSRGMYVEELKAFIGIDGFMNLYDYDDDLTTKGTSNKDFDIMKVFTANIPMSFECLLDEDNNTYLKLVWEREEPKEMTLEEIESALGYKIKLVEE